ncbi:MAG TPA: protein phosphatase 2C domain-containing protein [Nocardioidaceae bacterium]|nr:protein phosphatase 2C domain-containing protein [Nocardioidaceae bacterium]
MTASQTGAGLRWRFAALSDVGRVRKDNQDSGYAGPHLIAVADGVGGAARGDLASATAVQQLRRLDRAPGNDLLEQVAGAVHLTHDKLADLVAETPEIEGTSTTITAALFDGARIGVAHVGDSRGYLLRGGELLRLTKDHTFVQSLVDEGRITEDEARVHPHRNLILRAVDGLHEPEPDVFSHDLEAGDRLLLCSDGCCGVLDDGELGRLLGDGDLERAAEQLIRASLEAGSTDNVTVVLAEVVEAGPDLPPATPGEPPAAGEPAEHGEATEHGEAAPASEPGAAPLVVGAAAGPTRGGLSRPSLRRRRGAEADEEPLDPEALRYAPRPPRRFVWARRLALLLAVVLVLCLGGWWAYSWTQDQYYVGASNGRVAIYRGVEADIPGLRMHTLVDQTDLAVQALPAHNARAVGDGMSADSLPRARAIVHNLRVLACPPPAPPTPEPRHDRTAGPSAHRSGSSTGPRAGGTRSPSRSASSGASTGASGSASSGSPSTGSASASPSAARPTPRGADCSGVRQ